MIRARLSNSFGFNLKVLNEAKQPLLRYLKLRIMTIFCYSSLLKGCSQILHLVGWFKRSPFGILSNASLVPGDYQ